MTRPVCGDEITIRYNGGLTRATCTEVAESVGTGPGGTIFKIISQSIFHRGAEAFLVRGAAEQAIKVVQVISNLQKHRSIVVFSGVFEAT